MKMKRSILLFGWALLFPLIGSAEPEAFQVGADNVDQLPGGKEADGILHDLIIRNDRVEALIAFNSPRRRANMGTFYGEGGQTPGCLYDLTFRGDRNDQITVFSPSNQRGPITSVRIVSDGRDGTAIIETRVSAAMNDRLEKTHRYVLREGWSGLVITTTLANQSDEAKEVSTKDHWTRFDSGTGTALGVRWAAPVDPADKLSYAVSWIEQGDSIVPEAEIEIPAGETVSYTRFLAVGQSPAHAIGHVLRRQGPTGQVTGQILDAAGNPITTAVVSVTVGEDQFPAYPDDEGRFEFSLKPGEYELAFSDIGRPDVTRSVVLSGDDNVDATVQMEPASVVHFSVTDEDGSDIPCKVQFHGLGDTKNPHLGPQNRAHGCVDQYHSETGKFSVSLPPGDYEIRITHGTEFDHAKRIVKLAAGEEVPLEATLRRVVSTLGWISADFHNHSTPSGDNTCGTDDRIINLAAEHIEFAPTTEHNRIYDWNPHISRLGLADEIKTIVGLELTGSGAHFNSFPLEVQEHEQDGGAPVWDKDPRINAIVLRDFQKATPDRWLHINHPDMIDNFLDRDTASGADGGFVGLPQLIDGIETQNYRTSNILAQAPFRIVSELKEVRVSPIREFIWLQLLNQGHAYRALAVADAHSVYGNGVGGWRTYIPSSSDEPAEIAWEEISRNAKAGRMILSSGPFLEVITDDGTIAGGYTRANGLVHLNVKVQCTDWIDINRVQVLVNGRQPSELNFTRESHPDWFADGTVKFDQRIPVSLSQDSHLIVVAIGEGLDLSAGFGTSPQSELEPCAYNNPIFVDVDGGGFKPNGDTLGFSLPVKGIKVEEARRILGLN